MIVKIVPRGSTIMLQLETFDTYEWKGTGPVQHSSSVDVVGFRIYNIGYISEEGSLHRFDRGAWRWDTRTRSSVG